MARLKRKVAMCLMAHPDDCEILAAGTLVLLARRGWEVHVVTMTPGDAGSINEGPEAISATRRAEGAKAAAVIGGTYHCLESRDLYVIFDEQTIRRAMTLTRQIAPSLVFTHSLVDYMVDHEQAARIARSATFGFGVPNVCSGPVHPGSIVPYLYYADPIEGVDVYGERIAPTTFVNISSSMAAKSRALKAHASQREWLRKHHGMDQYILSMKDWGGKRGREFPVPAASGKAGGSSGGRGSKTARAVKYAEGFRQHKGHPYPKDCILQAELGTLVGHV